MTMTKGSWRKNVAEKDFGIDISVYSMVWLDNFMLAVIFYVPSSKNTEIWNWKCWFRNKKKTKNKILKWKILNGESARYWSLLRNINK